MTLIFLLRKKFDKNTGQRWEEPRGEADALAVSWL